MAFCIEHRLGVAAPPEVIWSILQDVPDWPSWGQIYRRAEGALKIGETIVIEVALPGEKPETVKAVVLDWAPDMQIHLRIKLYGGLITSTRYMEIEKLGEASCIFSNGEVFRGPLANFAPRRLRAKIRQGFIGASEALRARAEAQWAARQSR